MRLRLAVPVLAAVSALSLVTTVTSSATAAAPAIKFATWRVDLPGTDRVTAANLNAEYITLTNTTTKARNIGGYRVSDAGSKHTFIVPKGFVLGAKKTVTLRSGKGARNATNLYFGQAVGGVRPVSRNGFVWNNGKETATLRSAAGSVVHTCSYTRTKAGLKHC